MTDNAAQPDKNDGALTPPASSTDPSPAVTTPPSADVPAAPAVENLDKEVADAMAAMDPGDLAEICSGIPTGESTGSRTDDAEEVAIGAELVGTVAGVSDDEIFLEFGAKSQGILPRSQFGKKEVITPGRRVDVVVERFDAEAGLLVVNRQGSVQRATWTNLTPGSIVEGRVTGVIKGGLEIDIQGIRAFMPASQVDLSPMKDISLLLNEVVKGEVIELDRRSKNVILSRRKIMQRERKEAQEKLKTELEVGQIRKGVVGTITDFGAFVDLGGIDGLIHIGDLSWGTVEKVSDVLKPDQEVEVRILSIDTKRGRIGLGLKQALPDPWVGVSERYAVGTALKVRVVRTADFGVFAELEAGIDGLIPVSEMGWSRIHKPSEAVSIGDMVDVVVIRLEADKHRLALSMKQAQPDPWAGVLEGYQEQSLIKGKVTRLADFGVFVELAPGIEGLIHISELSDQRVRTCADVVKQGDEVEMRVLGVDAENRRISLSIKQVSAPTEPEAPAQEEVKKPKKKRTKPLRGGLSSHYDW